MVDNLTFYAPISKSDEETRMVYGYASTEALDSQGEIVKKSALVNAIDEYMNFANIREMHQPSAVGKTKKAQLDNKGLYIAAKIVDNDAWTKVKEGVYSGFSIGGKVKTMIGNEINALSLSEISLVDRPANPECKIDVFKRDMTEPVEEVKAEEKAVEVEKVAEIDQDLAKIEEGLQNGKMPTAEEVDLMIKKSGLPSTLEVRQKIQWECSGKIADYMAKKIAKAQEEGIKEEVKVEEPVVAPVETPVENKEEVKEETSVVETVVEPEVKEEVKEEVVEEKAEKTEDLEKAGKAISSVNAGKISSALSALQTAVAQLSELVQGDLTQDEKELIGDDQPHKAGSTMWNGTHVNAEIKDSALPPINNAEQIVDVAKVETVENNADLAKVETALADLKEQVKKLAMAPLPIKAYASYTVVEKFEASPNEELAKAERRSLELQALLKGPQANDSALQKEASELSTKIMQLRRIAK